MKKRRSRRRDAFVLDVDFSNYLIYFSLHMSRQQVTNKANSPPFSSRASLKPGSDRLRIQTSWLPLRLGSAVTGVLVRRDLAETNDCDDIQKSFGGEPGDDRKVDSIEALPRS